MIKYCPCHGNSHKKYVLLRLGATGQEAKIWRCNGCGREFDENTIPLHPPPSRRQWERKVELRHGYSKERMAEHDALTSAVEFYLENRR